MRAWSCFVILALSQSVFGQSVLLMETPVSGEVVRTELRTRVDGERIYLQDQQPKTQKIQLNADHRYDERVLIIHSKGGLVAKVARIYDSAKSTTHVGIDAPISATIRPDRKFMVAQRSDDGFVSYSPAGPLTAGELNLVGGHFDTLAVSGLLPGKEVATGGTWELGNPAALSLCGFEALESHKLIGTLTGAQGDKAHFNIAGVAKGIDLGAQVVLTINATGVFDLTKKKVVSLDWKQEDSRDQGPVSPGFKATVVVQVKRLPIEAPAELNDVAVKAVPAGLEAPAHLTALIYHDPQGLFELTHSRDWHLTGRDRQTTFRLVERGDLVAQADITPMPKAAAGQHLDPKEFREKVLESPGWQAEQVVDDTVVPSSQPGRFVYRVSALGQMNGLSVMQTFYLVAGANGDQAVIAFTTRQAQVGKLAGRDTALVEGLDFGKK